MKNIYSVAKLFPILFCFLIAASPSAHAQCPVQQAAYCGAWTGPSDVPDIFPSAINQSIGVGSATYTYFTACQEDNYVFSHCNSTNFTDTKISATYNGTALAYDDDWSGAGACSNTLSAYICFKNTNPSAVAATGLYYIGNFRYDGTQTNGCGQWAGSGTGNSMILNYIDNGPDAPGTPTTAGSYCTSTTLAGTANTANVTYYYETNPTGTLTTIGNGSSLVVSTVGTTTYYQRGYNTCSGVWGPAGGGCTITIAATPTTASVGSSTLTYCGVLSTGGLGGNSPVVGTGAWSQTSGPGTSTFSNASNANSSVTVSTSGTYVFRWTISNSPCTASTASVTVTFNPAPTTASVTTTPLNVCGTLTSTALGGNTPAIGTATWSQVSGPGTSTFSAINNGSSTATATVAGTYVYQWSISNSTCTPSTATVTVNYYATPTVAAISSSPLNYCGSLTSLSLGGNTATIGTGTWSQTSGPGTSTFSSINSPTSTVTVPTTGTYVYQWTIGNGTCSTTSASVTVNFYASPTTASVSSTPLNYCGTLTSASLGGNSPVSGTGTWTQVSGTGTSTFSNANSNTSTATATLPGTYVYQWSIANGTCTPSTATVTVNYYATPTTASISTNPINTCGSLTTGPLGGNVPTVGTGTWTQVSGPGTTFFGNANTGSSVATASVTGVYVYQWSIANGTCAPSTATVTVNYLAAPTTASITTTPLNYCGTLNSGSLGGNTATTGTGTWSQVSGPGTSTFSNNNDPAATATATTTGSYVYQWSITNGACTPSTATVTVNYYGQPTTATIASSPLDYCGVLTTGSLGGNTALVGTGTWTQTSGPGISTFSNVNSETSTATASAVGTYTYQWTIANGTCSTTSASVTVEYDPAPTTASVGNSTLNYCGVLASGSLGGNNATIGTGAWTQISGPSTSTFSNASNASSSATASAFGTYVYQWSITNSSCAPSTATVTVNFYDVPTTATIAVNPLSACGTLTTPPLGGNTPAVGIGTWTQTVGPGTSTFSNINDPASTATATVGGTYIYQWSISNGTCPASTSTVTVNYLASPTTATAGPAQSLCGSLTSAPLGGNTPAIGTGTWTQTAGSGVTFFSSVNSGSSTASVSVPGTYIFTWTISNGGCTSSANDTVSYYGTPTIATVGSTQNLCGTLTSNSLGGNTPVTGTGTWTQIAGPGISTFSNPNSGSSTATAPVTGSYTYEWTISNGTCTPSTADINVNYVVSPSGGSIAPSSYCSSIGSGGVQVVGVSNATQYSWALPAGLSGSSTSSSITVGGTLAGTYTVTVTPQNSIFGVTCSGTPITGTVTILAQPTIDSVHAGSISCFGGGNDTIIVYAHTGNGNLFYSLDGGTTFPNTTGVFPNLSANSYNVAVEDDSTCVTIYTNNPVAVTSPPNIFLSIASYGNVRCNGDSSGFIDVSATGGTGAFTFLWSNGATSQNNTHLEAGTFTVTATDANGCTMSISQSLTEPTPLTDTITATNVSCYGANDATATFTVNGGSPSYSYLWSNGDVTPSISNLPGGLYSVTATDNNGCKAVDAINIVNPLPITVSLAVTNVTCFGSGNGEVVASVSGGSGTYVYNWSPNVSSTNTVSNATPGTYTLTVSDLGNSSCNAVDSATVSQPLTSLSVSSIVTPVKCTNDTNGSIELLPSGGVGGYTYQWSNAQTLQIISDLPAGVLYTATVTDGNGCFVTISDSLINPTPITSSIVGTSATCAGAGGGSATLTVNGGVQPYTFLWSDLETTQNISNLTGGTYRVIITDANGCQHSDSVVITQPQPLVATITTTNVGCTGSGNGSITISVTGGTGAGTYGYAWTPNVSSTNTATNLSPGTYVVTVTDGNNCTLVDSATITQPAAPVSVIATVTNITCNNANNGSITTQVSGGSGSYTYLWSPGGATTPSITGLSANTYSVTVTDANSCTASANGTITNPSVITSAVTGTDVTCAGSADGTADVTTLSGGTAPYTFLWSTFDATQSISGLSGGLYHVLITDANGCEHRDSIFINEPLPLTATLTTTSIACTGAANGSITVSATGGTTSYTYTWTPNVSNTNTASNLAPGTYHVTVTDAHSCTFVDSATITQPAAALSVTATVTDITCNNANNGSISTQVSGGSGSYTYLWSPGGATTPDISGLSANTYTVTVTDANSCTASASGTITNPSAISSTVTCTNVTCAGSADGTATVATLSGGTAPYLFLWSNFDASQTIGGLSGGLYHVLITDANGCEHRDSVFITEPLPLTATITSTNIACTGAANGTITVTATGGTTSYTYTWTPNVSSTNTASNLAPGTYHVTVTDAHSCTFVDSATITQPASALSVIATVTNITCNNANNGLISTQVSGGSGSYTYLWSPGGATTPDISGLSANTYTVTVTDANSCTASAGGTITNPSAISSTVTGTNVTCAGNANGTATVATLSGGTAPYTFLWSNFAATQSISGLSGGLYHVLITDAHGCEHRDSVFITEPLPLTATMTSSNVGCNGAANGTITVTATGGTPAYGYTWSPNVSSGPTVTNAAPGVYHVTVTDAHSCTFVDSITVTQPQALTAVITVDDVKCFGANNGSVIVNVIGGSGSYSYTWSPNVGAGSTLTNLAPGTYHLTVTDGNSCTFIDSAVVTQPAAPITITSVIHNVTCAGANNGTILVVASGGTGSYTYLWAGGQITQYITGLAASPLSFGTVYTVTVTDANGCTAVQHDTLKSPAPITASIVGTNVTCGGASNGSAALTVSGGKTPYTYLWSNVTTNQNLTNVPGGFYTVIITDSNGCQLTDTITIHEPLPLTLSLTATNINCHGASNGTISASVSGGTTAYTYTWSPNVSSGPTVTNAAPGTYHLTVTDAHSCTIVDSITITQPALALTVSTTVSNITCNNANNGSISTQVSGGTGAYTYLWSPGGAVTPFINGLSANTYTVTVTDGNACTASASGTITNPSAITASITHTDVTCAGASNGSATLTVSGGTPTYTYQWSNLTATKDLTNVPGGFYTVFITDSSGCHHTDTVTIHEPQPLVITLTTTNINCNGAANGTITAAVTGGTTAYTYTWTPNVSSGPTVTNAAPGTYHLTVTDAHNCTASDSATITQPLLGLTVTTVVTDMTCHNANDGSISTQVSGGSGSYTYAWSPGAASTPDISGLSANTYTVTVTDANGCTSSANGTITNPSAISSSVTGTNVTCGGSADGTATVTTVSGGTAPYTYLWSNFAATQSIGNLSGGLIRVIITDAHGCEHRDSVLITEPLPLTGTITATNSTCSGGNTGTITVSATGGTGAYTYTWTPNVSSGPVASNLAPGTYHVTVTDAHNCTFIDSATITPSVSTLSVTALVTNMTCHDADNGAISTLVSGGSGAYSYLWNNAAASTTPAISGLSAGTYGVTVTDGGGCTASASGTITNPSAITSSVTGTNVTCAGNSNGTATVTTVSGGTAPYSYLWSTFAGTQSIDSLSGGLYYVIITDVNGCQHRDSTYITEPLPVTATLNVTQISCNNLNDGSITAVVTGGTGTINYTWSPTEPNTATISNLSANTYALTVSDVNNCSATASATIVNPSPLSVASVVINPRCNTANNGTVTLVVNGGTPAYSYTWSGALAGSGQSAINVAPGTYYVTVTDSHNCTATDSATVIAPALLYVSAIISDVKCHGNSDGSVIVTGYGGVLPYSYQWHYDSISGPPGPITKDLTQVPGGSYYLVITDVNGCSASFNAVVTEPDSLKATLTKTDVTCYGSSNGSVAVTPIGGTTPYHYLWNDFVTDSSQTGVAAGTYAVVVTDSNGCQQTKSVSVGQPTQVSVGLTATNPACNGSATGSVALNVSGGTGVGTYTYTWSTTPVQSTSTATNLSSGTYYVTVADGNSCTVIDSATLVAPQALAVNTAVNNPTCSDGNNGFISLDVRQGTAPYTYSWNTTPAQTGNVATDLVAGTYVATITDMNGCQLLDTAVVVAPQPIVIGLGSVGSATCVSSADGYAVVMVTGGLAPYTYQLGTLVQTSDTFTNLSPGVYAVTVKDANGCQAVSSWNIVSASSFTVQLTVDHSVILAGETIQLTATPTSDTTVTGYIWNTADSLNFSGCGDPNNCPTPTAMPTSNHTYIVEAVNARGCIATDTVSVSVSNQPSAFMPTAFTPNGDGINDRFEFDILGAKTVDVQIWNRWGEKVFSDPAQANGITGTNGWDGTFRGKLVEYDTYTYQFVITYLDGHKQTLAGTITVMR